MIRIPVSSLTCGNYIRWYFNGYHYWNFTRANEVIKTEGKNFATLGKKVLSMSSLSVDRATMNGLRSLMLSTDAYIYKDESWILINVLPGTQVIYNNEIDGYEMKLIIEMPCQ